MSTSTTRRRVTPALPGEPEGACSHLRYYRCSWCGKAKSTEHEATIMGVTVPVDAEHAGGVSDGVCEACFLAVTGRAA